MEGIIGTLEFYAPVIVLGVIVVGIVYFMKKRNDRKQIILLANSISFLKLKILFGQ